MAKVPDNDGFFISR